MIDNLLEFSFTISKYSISSFGTGIIAFFMLLVSLIFYYFIEKDEVLPYTMSIELAMFLYMFSYGFGVSSMIEANVIFWFRCMYVNITLLMIVSLYTVTFLAERSIKLLKTMITIMGGIIIFIICFTDGVITNEVEYLFHLTAVKGPLFSIFMIFHLIGVITTVVLIFWDMLMKKPNLRDIWSIYLGILFFLIYMYYSGYTSVYLELFRAKLAVNVLFYALMIIIFFYTRIRNNIRQKESLFNSYVYDSLTKVYSRNYFFELLKKDMHTNQSQLFIGMIDMNKFKYVNDKFGHLVGDEVLVKMGELLKGMHHHINSGRIGGDEFMIYSSKIREEELLTEIKNIMNQLKQYVKERGFDKSIADFGMSFGYAKYNNDMEYSDLISLCDEAMYNSKSSGNYCITKYSHELFSV